ncbi:uncharacterized protein BO80DRAFT_502725 [Aspergillus ibericus CBS 121593]|uniref:Uncharacterized protein n=1 Tax=Aspergillus ibericus CBS 121593 TaxID=1448316 RepID=A0A395GWV5_9EURO|nr:hypothetical protein BO80DRAFT_502725 [Aspergillus ibericus CBS 121593]RAL00072.1 hypothetical protein BO80DRAFT_502725 [Aspergillus ibericus CBS 121593]
MASPADLVNQALALSAANAELTAEVSQLEQRKDTLDGQFPRELNTLNSAIYSVHALGHALEGDPDPVARLTGLVRNALRPSPSVHLQAERITNCDNILQHQKGPGIVKILDLKAFGAAFHTIQQVNRTVSHLVVQAKDMTAHAAHLAHKATEQLTMCESTTRTLNCIREQSEGQLRHLDAMMARSKSQLDSVNSAATAVGNSARYHDRRSDEHADTLASTWWIPVVQLVTVPVSVIGTIRHHERATALKQQESQYRSRIRTMEAEKKDVEIRIDRLHEALGNLSQAGKTCSEVERESTRLKDQSVVLCEQLSTMSSAMRSVLDAMELVEVDLDPPDMQSLSLQFVESLRSLLEDLHQSGFLADANRPLLERLRSIQTPCDQDRYSGLPSTSNGWEHVIW